jgi:uncharacterized protein (TIGR02118 family)
MEPLVLGLWRSPHVASAQLHEALVGPWAAAAIEGQGVGALSVSCALEDQGDLVHPDNLDALVYVDLEQAHGLDDVPARDELHPLCRRIDVWRVASRSVIPRNRAVLIGGEVPGIQRVSLVRRRADLSHAQFVRHWTETHAALARRHHPALIEYTQHDVRRAYSSGGRDVDGIAELWFPDREVLERRFYDSDEGRAIIRADVEQFVARRPGTTTLLRATVVRDAR